MERATKRTEEQIQWDEELEESNNAHNCCLVSSSVMGGGYQMFN